MAQFGTLRGLFALPLHVSTSPSIRRCRCLGPLKPRMVLLTFRAPSTVEIFFFLPFKEGKRHPKCPIFWLWAKCGWKLSPKASLSSAARHRAGAITSLWEFSPSGKVRSWKVADGSGWNTVETRCVLSQTQVLTEGLSYLLGPQD